MSWPVHARRLYDLLVGVEFTDRDGRKCSDSVETVCKLVRDTKHKGNKVVLIGNGGSAAIASHVAIDLSKNALVPALAFNDLAALTCLANDFGYQQVFAKQVEYHCGQFDLLFAISSSGNSANIINAVDAAHREGMIVITFSGFKPDNRLRNSGNYNFYIPSLQYGFVELAHMAILHAIIDSLVGQHRMLEAAE